MSEGPERQQAPAEVVAWRLEAIERRLDAQAKAQDRGFADVRQQIAGLTFVRTDVYAADQNTANEVHAQLRSDIAELDVRVTEGFKRTDARINWSHATIGVALLGAVVAGIARLAGVS